MQETWEAVLKGLDRFEGRSSLKTWIFRILVNRAKTRGVRERRTVPFASLADAEAGEDFEAVVARTASTARTATSREPLGRADAALGDDARAGDRVA